MLNLKGILETAIHVADPATSAEWYRGLFGLETLLASERLIALDVGGRSVLLLFKSGATDEPVQTPGGLIPAHRAAGPTHFAFSIDAADEPHWRGRIEAAGVTVESTVRWSGGATSLYFRDLDGNLVELMTPGFWKGR
jgi:catechol 2,3-dioxygenase-like lactoylglutathione lyase family enzyme